MSAKVRVNSRGTACSIKTYVHITRVAQPVKQVNSSRRFQADDIPVGFTAHVSQLAEFGNYVLRAVILFTHADSKMSLFKEK